MKTQFVILTVAIINKQTYGFQLLDRDIQNAANCTVLSIKLTCINIISLQNGLIAYINHGRFTNPAINRWIKQKRINGFKPPVKLVFRLERKDTEHKYILYPNQGNFVVSSL